MQVSDIMHADVVTVSANDTFAQAASVLKAKRISSVVVMKGDKPTGIITERDVVNVVADGLDPATVRVGDRMATDLAVAEPRQDVAEAARLMGSRRIRHLPVTDHGRLVGIISIRDLTSWAVQELTGGHELPDIERSSATLNAAVQTDPH